MLVDGALVRTSLTRISLINANFGAAESHSRELAQFASRLFVMRSLDSTPAGVEAVVIDNPGLHPGLFKLVPSGHGLGSYLRALPIRVIRAIRGLPREADAWCVKPCF